MSWLEFWTSHSEVWPDVGTCSLKFNAHYACAKNTDLNFILAVVAMTHNFNTGMQHSNIGNQFGYASPCLTVKYFLKSTRNEKY